MNYLPSALKIVAFLIGLPLMLAACSLGSSEALPTPGKPSAGPNPNAGPNIAPSATTAPAAGVPTRPGEPSFGDIQPSPTFLTSSPLLPTPIPKDPKPSSGVVLLPEPPDRDLFDLARRFGKLNTASETAPGAVNEGGSFETGHSQAFFVVDLVDNTTYTIHATLKVVSENAYWYVDDAVNLSEEALRASAEIYETDIRAGMVASLGDISSPGVDGDPRLTVLHTPLRAADGYFGSSDQYPRSIHPNSNEREMIYMDAGRLTPGTSSYLSVLAHELQHAIHQNQDGGEDAWINEGMSELAKEQVGYDTYFVDSFLRRPDVQLNFWPDDIGTSGPHYGASSLFLAYLAQHYGGYQSMGGFVRDEADGANGVERYLSDYGTSFEQVFKDWTVANYLDAETGPYGYPDRAVKVRSVRPVFAELGETDSLPQFAARYYDLRLPQGDYLLKFSGTETVGQVATQCRSGARCWWSGLGDSVDSMLTGDLDLTGLTHATLEFSTWYDIEEGWDYAYVSVSTDGGETWSILKGLNTTADNPVGNNFGDGFTGSSGEWVQEFMDLSRFGGAKIKLRFEYVTDDAVNLDGFVVDDIAVPELGLLDEAEVVGRWVGEGFQLIDNVLPQKFAVQLIEFGSDGNVGVRDVALNEANVGEVRLSGFGEDLEHVVVVITPLTRGTYIPSEYDISIAAAPDP